MPSNLDAATLFRVDGLVAVITGGGTGLGLTMAHALAANGARKVYLLGRRGDMLAAAAARAAHSPSSVMVAVPCDVTSAASLRAAVDRVSADAGGYINLLVANAGIPGPKPAATATAKQPGDAGRAAPEGGGVEAMRRELFSQGVMDGMTQTLGVNVTGAFATMVAFLGLLEEGNRKAVLQGKGASLSVGGVGHVKPAGEEVVGGGVVWGRPMEGGGDDVPSVQSQVVFTSSIAGFSRSAMSTPSYAASKAALTHLTKHSSSTLARFGIRVNALAPGLFPSELAKGLIGDRDPGKESPDDPRFIPARRWGGDEEIAGTILYLASRAGSYCNGTILVMDGGRLAAMPSSY